MARTKDGGLHWEFVAWTAPDPGAGFTIMPSTVTAFENGSGHHGAARGFPAKGSELD